MRLPRRYPNIIGIIILIVWTKKYLDKTTHTATDSISRIFPNNFISVLDLFKNSKSNDLKYILLWTKRSYAPFYYFGNGTEAFVKNKCPMTNCYVTNRRDFFGGDLTKFHAIAFNGRNIRHLRPGHLPKQRSPHQKYIFFNTESAESNSICNEVFNGFFNWTATYKLNSDIVYPYLEVRNKAGEEIGPKVDMKWNVSYTGDTITKFSPRKKAAVWVASNCYTKSRRERYVRKLSVELELHQEDLDVYGRCGSLRCPRKEGACENRLKNKYYFYLAFENSLAEDYVSEKVYFALKNNMVPVVRGGANYSRFLPPGSYIDASEYSLHKVVQTMVEAIKNRTYGRFFRWKQHYTFHRPNNVCRVCDALNNKTLVETPTVYEDFRRWWNPSHMVGCKYRDRGRKDVLFF